MASIMLSAVWIVLACSSLGERLHFAEATSNSRPHSDDFSASAGYVASPILNPVAPPKCEPQLRLDLFEGDIILGAKDDYRSAVSQKWHKWNNGVVPYIISPAVGQQTRDAIRDAIGDFNKFTCIQFVPKKVERDYVEFINGTGCFAAIGKNGGRQTVSLGKGCDTKGTAIHEMMHAVGFHHEQSRSDRDDFIWVLWRNIEKESVDQFKKYSTNNLNLPYDYNSVMHTDVKAFSKNGLDTMVPKFGFNLKIGQRQGFSLTDVEKINSFYGCPERTKAAMQYYYPPRTTTKRPDFSMNNPEPPGMLDQNPPPFQSANCNSKQSGTSAFSSVSQQDSGANKPWAGGLGNRAGSSPMKQALLVPPEVTTAQPAIVDTIRLTQDVGQLQEQQQVQSDGDLTADSDVPAAAADVPNIGQIQSAGPDESQSGRQLQAQGSPARSVFTTAGPIQPSRAFLCDDSVWKPVCGLKPEDVCELTKAATASLYCKILCQACKLPSKA